MNALMMIDVRVRSAAALAQLRGLEMASTRAAGGVGAVGKRAQWGLPIISKWGNQVQWAGRQLMYNFTLPLGIAAIAATKFQLDNEKAMVRVAKVYGDNSKIFKRLSKTELPALGKAFEALSNQFGVARSDVINIAADWAAAGASGVALAKSTSLTLQTMILGEIDAAAATKQLIAIQAQYGFNVKQLAHTIDILNMVENQTGATMKDLMDGMARAAGVARVAGVDVEHLSAMMAALVPATGSAATAGNALKTIISRLLAPTSDAADLLGKIGINVKDAGWQSMSAADRIELLAKRYSGLSDAAKANIASVIGSRWQFNRLVVLLEDVNRQHGYYQKSLKATSDRQAVFNQKQKELNQVLTSNPQRLKQAWVILQNAMANIIMPLIPALVELGRKAGDLAHWFENLSIGTQKWVLLVAILLAVVGPLARYIGALTNLVGLLAGAFHFLSVALWSTLKVLPLMVMWFIQMAAIPFRAIAAGLMMIGSAAIFMGGAVLRGLGFFFAPLIAALKGQFVILQFVVLKLWDRLLFAMTVTAAAMVAPFRVLGQALSLSFAVGMSIGGTIIAKVWAGILMAMTILFAQFTVTMRAAWAAFVVTMSSAGLALRYALVGSFAVTMRMLGIVAVVGFKSIFTGIIRLIPLLLRVLVSPWGLAITAIFLLLNAFKDQVGQIIQNVIGAFQKFGTWLGQNFSEIGQFFQRLSQGIVNAFWALPEGVRNAMLAVLNIVVSAAKQVYEWMSYLNPFARHSPSLVDQVKAGNAAIRDEYARTSAAVKKHKDAIRKNAINDQEKVVARWKAALDRANNSLDDQEKILDRLKDSLQAVQDLYDAHQQAAQDFANAPLKGMQAMSDAIFQNEQAQKALQLQMMKWEDVNGSLEDAQNRLSGIAGSLEQLRGEATSLRAAGAGSDVLGPINDQVTSMEKAAADLRSQMQNSPIAQMQQQLDQLQRQGQEMDLAQSLQFDPLTRQIDQLANAQKEISFDDAVAGIKREQAAMAGLQPQIDKLTAAVNSQSTVVQKAKDVRDQISDKYDKERAKLEQLKKSYDDLTGSIKNASAATKGKNPSFIESSFAASQGGNFPTVGGDSKIGREGGLKDQSKLIEQFTQQTQDQMGAIWGSFDMFGPIKEKWKTVWAWIETNVGPVTSQVASDIQKGMGNIGGFFGGDDFKKSAEDAFNKVWEVISPIWDKIKSIIDLFAPDFKRAFGAVVDAAKRLWDEVGPNLVGLFNDLWPVIKLVAIVLGIVLVAALKVAASILGHVFVPALDMIITVLNGVITFIRGVVNIIVGLFTLDLGKVIEGVTQIFTGMWNVIWGIFSGAWNILVGIIQGIVGGIVSFFQWLYDQLVGHSIIPDIVNGIFFWFGKLVALPVWLWENVLKPVFGVIKDIWNNFIQPFLATIFTLWKGAWSALFGIAGWLWSNILIPIFNKIKGVWDTVISPFLSGIFGAWKSVWQSLTGMGQWVYDNVMQPIINKIQDGWNAIKNWLTDNKNMLLAPIKGIINVVIKGINKLIDGLNLVSQSLPGINFHIDAIPEFAAGGPIQKRRVGNGFITQGARAIVGEGKANYPEYVIPTDPTYRGRAAALLVSAAQRLNVGLSIDPTRKGILGDSPSDMMRALSTGSKTAQGAVPMFDNGGLLGTLNKIASGIKKTGSWVKDDLQKLASAPFAPFLAAAKLLVNQVDYAPVRGLGNQGIDIAESWVTGVDKVWGKKAEDLNASFGGASGIAWNGSFSSDARISRAQKWAASQAGKPYMWGGVGPDGYDCSGFMSAVTNVIRGQDPHHRLGSTASFPWAGFGGGINPNGFTIGSTQSYAGGIGHMAGTLAGMNVESRGGRGVVIGSAARGYGDGGFSTRAHLLGLREGAIIRARMGGTVFRGGEGGNDEAVVPLPKKWREQVQNLGSGNGKTEINIYGDLSFPNINNGNDANEFIKNLEILARTN